MFRLAIVGAKSFARTFKRFAGEAKRVAGRGSGTIFEVQKSLESLASAAYTIAATTPLEGITRTMRGSTTKSRQPAVRSPQKKPSTPRKPHRPIHFVSHPQHLGGLPRLARNKLRRNGIGISEALAAEQKVACVRARVRTMRGWGSWGRFSHVVRMGHHVSGWTFGHLWFPCTVRANVCV